MKVLVTGSTGFVGRALCRHLEGRGHDVVRAVRRSRGRCHEVAIGDLGPDTNCRPALSGDADPVDVVVHLAARVHRIRDAAVDPLAEFRRVNTLGTKALARRSAEAGVRRLVFLSSIKVNGESTPAGKAFSGDDRPDPQDAYAVSKWEAEQTLSEIGRQTGLEIVVLRPPLVYGPGVKANFLSLLRWIDRGRPLPLGRIRNRRSLLYLENLLSAIEACLTHPNAAGQVFLPSDGAPVSTPELARLIGEALRRPARLVPVPLPLLRLAARLVGRSGMVARLTDSLVIDSAPLRERLDWRPVCPLAEGLSRTCTWYRQHGRT